MTPLGCESRNRKWREVAATLSVIGPATDFFFPTLVLNQTRPKTPCEIMNRRGLLFFFFARILIFQSRKEKKRKKNTSQLLDCRQLKSFLDRRCAEFPFQLTVARTSELPRGKQMFKEPDVRRRGGGGHVLGWRRGVQCTLRIDWKPDKGGVVVVVVGGLVGVADPCQGCTCQNTGRHG